MIAPSAKIRPVVFLLAAAVAVLFAFVDAQSLRGRPFAFAVGRGKTMSEV